jgi:hypothetical protein
MNVCSNMFHGWFPWAPPRGRCYASLQRRKTMCRWKPRLHVRGGWVITCMHAKEKDRKETSNHLHAKPTKKKLMSSSCLKIKKKSINHKSSIKIEFRFHHWIPDNKNFETRSHLTIFWQTFLFVFLIKVIYNVIAWTKRIIFRINENNCQNKFVCHPKQQM